MAGWDDGYVTDVVYTSNFHRETTPAWLAAACLLLGHRPPDLSRPFRYADLGCGNGFTAATVAATCPHAEIWAFDFNPAHIEAATALAARAGLTNIRFQEASFAEIDAMPAASLPAFDFIVAHGVLSWVSAENRAHLVSIAGGRLRPGGVAYLSYNVATGCSDLVPLHTLMRMLASASQDRSDLAVPGILAALDRIKAAGALFFQTHPGLDARLADLRKQDPRYLAHELLNQNWHAPMFADVAAAMATVKCGFIGSATLPENLDGVSAPPGMVPLLAEAARDPILRETLRDLGTGQNFRRDLYRRGTPPLPPGEHQALLDELRLAWTGQPARDAFTLATPFGTITGKPEVYRPLRALLESGPLSLRRARSLEPFAGRPLAELTEVVALLIASGFAHPLLPDGGSADGRAASMRLNRAIADLNALGAEFARLVFPAIGTSLGVDFFQTLALGDLLAGGKVDLEALTTSVLERLHRGGRTLRRDGQEVADPAEARAIVEAALREMFATHMPSWRRLGVLETRGDAESRAET